MAALGVLKRMGARAEDLREIWVQAIAHGALRVRRCPHCHEMMGVAHVRTDGPGMPLDVCTKCQAVWFDASEIEALRREIPRAEPVSSTRQAVRKEVLRHEPPRAKPAPVGGPWSPPERWNWIVGILGLPVECDAPRAKQLPLATWLITAACAVVVLLTYGNLESVVNSWGFTPDLWSRHSGLTLLTSFFLHGGIWHLVSNMYFLLLFGDNVEDHLGRPKYLTLIALGHLAGMVMHAAIDPNGHIPSVGASAGISAVIAYYAVTFPHVRLGVFLTVLWVYIPAWGAMILYVIFQGIGAAAQAQGGATISYLAHLGGLGVGFAAGIGMLIARSHRMHRTLRSPEPDQDVDRDTGGYLKDPY